MRSHEPAVDAALHAWQAGVRRLSGPDPFGLDPLRGQRGRIVEAVIVELRRRVGPTFTLADLAGAYDGAGDWYTELALRVAPASPEAWDASVALDGAFGLYARLAIEGPSA